MPVGHLPQVEVPLTPKEQYVLATVLSSVDKANTPNWAQLCQKHLPHRTPREVAKAWCALRGRTAPAARMPPRRPPGTQHGGGGLRCVLHAVMPAGLTHERPARPAVPAGTRPSSPSTRSTWRPANRTCAARAAWS